MKKILKKLALPIIVLALTGCTEDILDEINFNKNNPADVASRLMLPDLEVSTAFNMTSSDMAFYASVYIEHNVGIFGQMNNAEIRAVEPESSTTYNNQWRAGYFNLYNLKLIINKTSEGGSEQGNHHMLGIAQILTAYNLAIMTDGFGDIPYTEALQPGKIYQPKLDKQEALYSEIFTLLDNGIANLAKESNFTIGNHDFIYGGNTSKWTKFAQGLKARYTTRLALRNGGKWQDVINYANLSFTSNSEQALIKYNGGTSKSPFYTFYTDRDYFGASQSLHDKLVALNDPRDEFYFKKHPKASNLLFAPNGSPIPVQAKYGISALMSITAPTYLMSYHELEFLKAEAYARLNDPTNAKASLIKAVTAAFEKIGQKTLAASYIDNQVIPRFEADPLKEIMLQKYLAFFEEEALEAYNDIRRLKAEGKNYITLAHPQPELFPLRFTYGDRDVTTNPNVASAYGDGRYVYTEKVWWAGGTR